MTQRELHPNEAGPLQFDGGRNIRDIGGYPAADGRHVRRGRLYRSGSLHALTEADRNRLLSLNIKAICDLRTNEERERERFPAEAFPGVAYWYRDYETSFADLRRTLTSGLASGDSARRAMISGYRNLPFDQAPAFRQLFAWLDAGTYPLIFNCTAGKDRTGTAAGLLLASLGVPRHLVIADYLLTNQILGRRRAPLGEQGDRTIPIAPEVITAITTVEPAYLEAAFDEIETRCGGLQDYLRIELGIGSGELTRLRNNLLE